MAIPQYMVVGPVKEIPLWGNSQGLRFAKHILEEARIAVGDEVEVSVENRVIIVRPKGRAGRKYDLGKLTARMPRTYKADEEEWGSPVGKEAW